MASPRSARSPNTRLVVTCNFDTGSNKEPNAATNYQAIYLHGQDNLSQDAHYTVTVDTLELAPLKQGLGQPVRLAFIADDGHSHTVCHTLLAIEDKGLIGAHTEHIDLASNSQSDQPLNAKRRYQLTIGSRLSLLDNTAHSRIYVDTSLADILAHLLARAGYHGDQLQFSVSSPLPVLPQCVQAMESSRAFFDRLLGQYGLFYYFDSRDSQPSIVITDSNQASPYLSRGLVQVHPGAGFVRSISASTLVENQAEQSFVGFSHCQVESQLASGLATAMSAKQTLSGDALATHNLAQPVSTTAAQASNLAQAQSLALNCFNEVITLTGNTPDIFAGCSFSLNDTSGLNASGDYLCISVEHHCQQPSDETSQDGLSQYYCVVKAIPRATPFKLALTEPAPLPMVFSAKVEALGGVPTLSDSGDYCVKLDFDHTAQAPLKSSQPLRKLVNYACANQAQATGWHFPLTQDTQVLIGCFNNDPSQAYILGFAMNDEQPSLVTSQNHWHNRLVSRAGHELRFDDNENAPTIILQTLGGEHYLELNGKAGEHYIQWLSRLGSIRLVAGKDILLASQTANLDINAGRSQQLDIKGAANIQAKNQAIAIHTPLSHQQTAKNISLSSEQNTTLLTGRNLNIRAENQLTAKAKQDNFTINVPNGSTLINANGDIRIEGTGNGHITLFNQGGMIKLDSQGNVELIGTNVLTLNGQTTTFDGDIKYEITSPNTASEPSTASPPSITRIPDINLGDSAQQTISPQTIQLAYHYQDGEPVQNAPYKITLSDGSETQGALDSQGQAQLENMPTGQFMVQFGEDSRAYQPVDNTRPNPLYGKISPQQAVTMVESGDTSLLAEAGNLAASAGDWLWGTLQGDFNENPSTAQIVVGSVISMIPVIDQVMDCRDVCANIMLLADDDQANDTNGWIALTLTGIGFIPVLGSAVKGVGKVIIKHADTALSVAAATLRKVGKGDPVAYIKNINWQDLGKQATNLIKEKITAIRDALNSIASSWFLRNTLSDNALLSLKESAENLNQVLPKIDQGIVDATSLIEQKVEQAIKTYEGELPHIGRTGVLKTVKTDELTQPKDKSLNGDKRKANRRIDDDLYNKLRKATPTPKIRNQVNKGKKPPYPDEALPGLTVTGKLEADHIVSMDRISRMVGFEKLTLEQQKNILNFSENFVGLSKIANTSKGSKSFSEWTIYKKKGIKVSQEFKEKMIKLEKDLEIKIQKKINDMLSQGGSK